MHQRGIGPQCGEGIGDRRQVLISHVDQLERLQRGDFVHCRHRRHRLPDIADFVAGQNAFVLHRPVAKAGIRDILPGDHGPHAGQVLGAGGVDAQDAGMRFGGLSTLHISMPGR